MTYDYQITDIQYDEKGLVPCIAVDDRTKRVLMLAYMNETALRLTLESGIMTYYSRSRQMLWIKGETSGNYQHVKRSYMDCDGDALIFEVEQLGVACHTGAISCFYPDEVFKEETKKDTLQALATVIKKRRSMPQEGSYTNYLLEKGLDKILKKVGEETAEVIIASKNNTDEVIYEAADLVYHLMVLFEVLEISHETVLGALDQRALSKD